VKIKSRPHAIHLQGHLQEEQSQKQKFCIVEEMGEPLGLVVMDDGHAGSVESHKAQHNPVGGPIHLCTFDAGSGKRCA